MRASEWPKLGKVQSVMVHLYFEHLMVLIIGRLFVAIMRLVLVLVGGFVFVLFGKAASTPVGR